MAIQQEGSLEQPIPYQPPATGAASPTDATTSVAGQGAESEFSRTLERQMDIDGRLSNLLDGGRGVGERGGRLNQSADDSSRHGEL